MLNYSQSLTGATGVELIIALYDGAIRFLYRAMRACENDDIIDRRYAVKRALDILIYLQARLRLDVGGKPAESLADFYAVMFQGTLEASASNAAEEFAVIIASLQNVREAWIVVSRDPKANAVMPRDLRSPVEPAAPTSLPSRLETQPRLAWSA